MLIGHELISLQHQPYLFLRARLLQPPIHPSGGMNHSACSTRPAAQTLSYQ